MGKTMHVGEHAEELGCWAVLYWDSIMLPSLCYIFKLGMQVCLLHGPLDSELSYEIPVSNKLEGLV
jgi:hypothetical protein